jgi:hypothetical protein
MPKLSEKKAKSIRATSFVAEVVEKYGIGRYGDIGQKSFMDNPPEQWDDYERQLFDICMEIEDRMRDRIVEIVEGRVRS